MEKKILRWNDVFELVKKRNINSFNRIGLCYPINEFRKGIRTNPFTIFDHQKNYGSDLGYQKEGIEIRCQGNPKDMWFEHEMIFFKK